MKNSKALFIAINLVVLTAHAAGKADDCVECSELSKINEETMKERKSKKPDFDALQLRATALIQKMPDKSGKLTGEQIKSAVAAFEASVENDPAYAIIENNLEILKKNRPAFDREISMLPKKRADKLRETIQIVLGSDSEGTDPSSP